MIDQKTIAIFLVVLLAASVGSYFLGHYMGYQEGLESRVQNVKIGVLLPLTGSVGAAGQDSKRIYDLVVDEYNQAGGIKSGPLKGATIELVYADFGGETALGVTECERLILVEKVDAILLTAFSSVGSAIQPICEREQTPLILDGTSAKDLTTRSFNYTFRPTPHDVIFFQGIFQLLDDLRVENPDVDLDRLLMLHSSTESSVYGWEEVQRLNDDPELGGYELKNIQYPVGDFGTFEEEIQVIKTFDPDVLLLAIHWDESIIVQRGLKLQDVNPEIMIGCMGAHLGARFTDAVGNLSDGLLARNTWNWDLEKPVSKEWDDKFQDLYGEHIYDGRPWISIYTAIKAFEESEGTEGEQIKEALVGLKIPAEDVLTPFGVEFYPPGHPEQGQNMLATGLLIQYFGTEMHTVWPFDYASKDIVFPLPTWEERGL